MADAVNVFSVRTYGAAGDGTADDTSAIQDAVDARCHLAGRFTFQRVATG